ncbi:MAG: FtsB family cell division protein [Bacillota bacterium]|uniref:Septum formation initiator n=2 Tax=Carboxydocella TaxID=178898 RepID=A0A1T4SEI8_9FIRM|nr:MULTISPECIES: septum formation initiator family protein [Carboxydocella]AVX19294.1 cell division protein FtsL [Carboxydocella thermautotrophica]AVX29709.1 cell division protein FtsL [Carboxydocella thermautotrophica]SKA26704.1 Septum formation initiator [Carboxydocella sporoproducens DSM 16521]
MSKRAERKIVDLNQRLEKETPKKVKTGSSKSRFFWRRVVVGIFLAYSVIVVGSFVHQTVKMNQLEKEISSVQNKIKAVEMSNTKLKEEIKLLQTDEYIERRAREELNLVKPGEKVVIPAVGKKKQ